MEKVKEFDPNVSTAIPDTQTWIEGKSKAIYRRAETLPFQRYALMADYQLEMLYGRDAGEMFKVFKTIYGHLNSRDKLADASVLAYNAMKGAESIRERKVDPMQKIAMLFWNKEGEDPLITDEQMEHKCRDVEHLDTGFFFVQAASCIADFLTASSKGSPATSARTSQTESERSTPSQDAS